jgi:hypothetical protein
MMGRSSICHRPFREENDVIDLTALQQFVQFLNTQHVMVVSGRDNSWTDGNFLLVASSLPPSAAMFIVATCDHRISLRWIEKVRAECIDHEQDTVLFDQHGHGRLDLRRRGPTREYYIDPLPLGFFHFRIGARVETLEERRAQIMNQAYIQHQLMVGGVSRTDVPLFVQTGRTRKLVSAYSVLPVRGHDTYHVRISTFGIREGIMRLTQEGEVKRQKEFYIDPCEFNYVPEGTYEVSMELTG